MGTYRSRPPFVVVGTGMTVDEPRRKHFQRRRLFVRREQPVDKQHALAILSPTSPVFPVCAILG
jgi:hypothetical protein